MNISAGVNISEHNFYLIRLIDGQVTFDLIQNWLGIFMLTHKILKAMISESCIPVHNLV